METERIARELLARAGIEGFPGRLGREALFELYPALHLERHDEGDTWISHLAERTVILLSRRLRSQEREEVLWHELPHGICRFEELSIWVPARNGAGSFRLALQADRVHEAFCERLERALRLPFGAMNGLSDEEILEASGVSCEMLALRREDLLR